MKSRSLKSKLLTWLITPLLLFGCLSSYITYKLAVASVDEMNDDFLLNSADSVLARIKMENGAVQVDLPAAAEAMLRHNFRDKFYYEVSESNGAFLSGDPNIPGPTAIEASGPTFYSATINGEKVRVVKLAHSLENGNFLIVQCAETLNARRDMYKRALMAALGVHFLFIVFVVVAVFFGIGQGLLPLKVVEEKISQQMPLSLEPIDVSAAPSEVTNLISTINNLFETLRNYIRARERFLANAAHQLRTPLAGAKTYVELAIKQVKDEQVKNSLERADLGLNRMRHLIDRLLVLERSESETVSKSKSEIVDLNDVAAAAAFELADLAVARGIELECAVADKPVNVVGERASLLEMLKNLLENAIHYSDKGKNVAVSVEQGEEAKLVVKDEGIGIPESERTSVFERFYRLDGTQREGSGLGLAIVKEIVDAHGAHVSISSGAKGVGTQVEVTFPIM
jgi:two-component system sensor histidine kinase TctE